MESDDLGPRILITTWTITGLAFAFLVVRLACKLRTKRYLWWDDYVLALSWVMLVASIALITLSVTKGLGKHAIDVPPENYPILGVVGNLTGTFSILAATWSKTSFALTLLRLMQGRLKILLWFLIVTINIFMGLNALFMWVRCTPVERTWNPFAPGTCWEDHIYPNYGMFAAGYSAAAEFALALLPWKVIWKLQMKRKEKVGVALAMSMGIFAGATACVKTTEIPLLASPDFTCKSSAFIHSTSVANRVKDASAPLIYWGCAESGVTIIAASIPILRTLFRDLNTLSRKYYIAESKNATQNSRVATSKYIENTVVISAGPVPELSSQSSNLSEKVAVRDSQGHILQSTEVMVAVEYRAEDEKDLPPHAM